MSYSLMETTASEFRQYTREVTSVEYVVICKDKLLGNDHKGSKLLVEPNIQFHVFH